VHAVALALEAAGLPPRTAGGTGYTVTGSPDADEVRVAWAAPAGADVVAALEECARALTGRGWQATRHTDRTGAAFLLVTARRR
jgi:hypothetical protein